VQNLNRLDGDVLPGITLIPFSHNEFTVIDGNLKHWVPTEGEVYRAIVIKE